MDFGTCEAFPSQEPRSSSLCGQGFEPHGSYHAPSGALRGCFGLWARDIKNKHKRKRNTKF